MESVVPTPPDNEAARQKAVHGLRAQRALLARRLRNTDYTDNKVLVQLIETNARIEGLRYVREGGIDMNEEPTLDQIEERGDGWYWEEWREETDEEEYE
jgi:hypothetical protein